ncbi:MerR family transcriptional regulator [Holdemania filiformis]|uniref:MerR family transcriptional regulator n=1 Tax=Holdemania filiformis TaxID=61171 RepID=UPI00266FBF67|nr:MerR family transcriptional regulator [Holdemania filiformis]
MRIQEVCRKTGLTKKAIYFYIDQGLITPDRNAENNYLDFSEADVGRLQIIALLRQYNVPVGAVEELFRYPSMTNFYLHRQLADLRAQLLRQLGLIRSLSTLLTELPPQYNVANLKEQVGRSTAATEADQSMLDLVCPDQDARMISIFIWSSFLNVPKSEYRLFLWGKITEQAQQELKGSLRYVARIIYALDSEQIENDARQRYHDSQAILKMQEDSYGQLRQRIMNRLRHLADDPRDQAYWTLNYEKVTLPLVRFVNGLLGDLIAEYNSEYLVYLKNMQRLAASVRRELLEGAERDLYERLMRVLNGKLDLDQYPGLISFYTFEMGLYMILPLAKQRQLLEE